MKVIQTHPSLTSPPKATFKKRYITLAPIAGVVGLAFNLKDPKKLLKGVGSEGITIALLEKGHPGMRIGQAASTFFIDF
jgi:acyl-CoA dehydrogenase